MARTPPKRTPAQPEIIDISDSQGVKFFYGGKVINEREAKKILEVTDRSGCDWCGAAPREGKCPNCGGPNEI